MGWDEMDGMGREKVLTELTRPGQEGERTAKLSRETPNT